MKTIVIGGSKGIGKAIADSLTEADHSVIRTSSSDLDTSNIQQVQMCLDTIAYKTPRLVH